jgi:hypothetical protein
MSKIKTVLVAVLGVACVLGAAGCSSSGTTSGTASGSTPTTHKVSKGLAAHAGATDVKLGRWHQANSPVFPVVTVKVVITNSSSKRSDYVIDLALESADGTMQYETTPVLVEEGYRGFNIVRFQKKQIGVSQSLGSVDLAAVDDVEFFARAEGDPIECFKACLNYWIVARTFADQRGHGTVRVNGANGVTQVSEPRSSSRALSR